MTPGTAPPTRSSLPARRRKARFPDPEKTRWTPIGSGDPGSLSGRFDLTHVPYSTQHEDGVAGGDGEPFIVAGVGRNAVKEHARLELPLAQVGAQDLDAVGRRQLAGGADAATAPEDQHHVAP